MIPFNKKKHSDITVTVSDGAQPEPHEQTFFLHKFPLISKSHYFDENIPETQPGEGPLEMRIMDFPGGPAAFETVAKYCYGIDIELSTEDIAYTYCACRYLRIPELEKSTEEYMANMILPDPRSAARVLRVATSIGACGDRARERDDATVSWTVEGTRSSSRLGCIECIDTVLIEWWRAFALPLLPTPGCSHFHPG